MTKTLRYEMVFGGKLRSGDSKTGRPICLKLCAKCAICYFLIARYEADRLCKHADDRDHQRRRHGRACHWPGPGPGRPEDGRLPTPCRRSRVLDPKFDGRVSRAGLCQRADADGAGRVGRIWSPTPSRSTKSWSPTARRDSRPRPSRCISIAGEIGADALGHIAENRHIRAALYDAVPRRPI